jgi:CheY-like chemotaxis protein
VSSRSRSVGPASWMRILCSLDCRPLLHQSTAWPDRVATVFWLQRWLAPTEMSRTMLQTAWEEIEDAGASQWGQLMNKSSGVPIIAVVDDDESVRESLADLAESVGYEAALFASAEEFLKSVHHRESLSCLILDVRLPGMSGVELYTQLPVSLRSIPTIFITAHADPEVNTWATKPGVIALLYKPFQPAVLLQAVRKAITQSWT